MCEPSITLFGADRVAYRDEADQFYDDPLGFMEENFPSVLQRPTDAPKCEGEKRYQWPDKLVMFQQVADVLEKYMGIGEGGRYYEVWISMVLQS